MCTVPVMASSWKILFSQWVRAVPSPPWSSSSAPSRLGQEKWALASLLTLGVMAGSGGRQRIRDSFSGIIWLYDKQCLEDWRPVLTWFMVTQRVLKLIQEMSLQS